jgi:hypothetical protein
LLLHARAGAAESEHLNVLFEDVRAVNLRSSYQPLILGSAGDPARDDIPAFAGIPPQHRHRYLALELPSRPAESGCILCARVTVLGVDKADDRSSGDVWPTGARVTSTRSTQRAKTMLPDLAADSALDRTRTRRAV